jgi:Bacterial antitoxin of type II TA system, VapB
VKTTIEIADPLLDGARRLAVQRHTTVRSVMEEALRRYLDEELQRRESFRLEDGRFKSGDGMRPEFEGNWDAILDAAYEGRGA